MFNNNNNNNFKKSSNENDIKNFESSYELSRKASFSTEYAEIAQRHGAQSNDATVSSNDSRLSFYTTPMASTLVESTSNSNNDLKSNVESTIEILQNGINLENGNNNTSFLIEKLQQQLLNDVKKDNNEQVQNNNFFFNLIFLLSFRY